MPKKGHSEEQIIAALRQYESGDRVQAFRRAEKPGERLARRAVV